MNFYEYSGSNTPLIINTHGYASNIGENILYDLLRIIEPDVMIILGKSPSKETQNNDGYLNNDPAAEIESEVRRRTFHDRASIIQLPKSDYKGPTIW
jgi:polynucleotide 5'-kinase involved in rRNA processing